MREIPYIPPKGGSGPVDAGSWECYPGFRIIEYPDKGKFEIEERRRWFIFPKWVRVGPAPDTVFQWDSKPEAELYINNVLWPGRRNEKTVKSKKIIHTN